MDGMDKEELERLQNSAEQINSLSQKIIKRVNDKLEELQKRENRLKTLDKAIEENASKMENKVIIDVGGKRFATTKDTLFSHPDTYFTSLLGSGQFKPHKDGAYFIDRSPKYFSIILDYLRHGELSIDHLNSQQKTQLQQELDFYQVLPEKLQDNMYKESEIISRDQATVIEEWLGVPIKSLLWSSKNKYDYHIFKTKSTVVVVRDTTGNIYGGSAPKRDTMAKSFVFNFTNMDEYSPPSHYTRDGIQLGDLFIKPNVSLWATNDFPGWKIDTASRGNLSFIGSYLYSTNIDKIEIFEF